MKDIRIWSLNSLAGISRFYFLRSLLGRPRLCRTHFGARLETRAVLSVASSSDER